MRRFVAGGAVLALAISTTAHAAVFYEPFDYPTGSLGLNLNSSVNQTWYSTVASGADDRVQVSTGSLSGTGVPDSVGNMATFGGAGRTDRIFLGQNRTTGEVYYSLLRNVSDLTGAATGGATIFGFNTTAQIPALYMDSNSSIAGDVSFTSETPVFTALGTSTIAGYPAAGAQAAPHIHKGVEMPEFPAIDPSVFVPFATNILNVPGK